jgi:hypothetical protein
MRGTGQIQSWGLRKRGELMISKGKWRRRLAGICYGLGFLLVLGHRSVAWSYPGEIPLEKQAPPPPPGTVITHANWEQYKDYMTLGQQLFWAGKLQWKFKPDLRWRVVPTKPWPIPPYFRADSAKYSGQVRLKKLPNGGTLLENYVAGLPFPQITEPDAGAKVLQNVFYRFAPLRAWSGPYFTSNIDRFGNAFDQLVYSHNTRLAFVSDPVQPHTVPDNAGFYYSSRQEVVEPETAKYVTQMTNYYVDQTRPEASWSFIPSLRRVLRLSTASRCSSTIGTDIYREDLRGGFYGGNYRFAVKLVAHKKLLAATNFTRLKGAWPTSEEAKAWGFYNYVAQPPDAEWEVRDVYVIELMPVPELQAGYCYQPKRIYADGEMFCPLGTENYDPGGKLWKISVFGFAPIPDGYGNTYMAGTSDGWFDWVDIENNHATELANGPGAAAGPALPQQFQSVERWAMPSGLAMIMQ